MHVNSILKAILFGFVCNVDCNSYFLHDHFSKRGYITWERNGLVSTGCDA